MWVSGGEGVLKIYNSMEVLIGNSFKMPRHTYTNLTSFMQFRKPINISSWDSSGVSLFKRRYSEIASRLRDSSTVEHSNKMCFAVSSSLPHLIPPFLPPHFLTPFPLPLPTPLPPLLSSLPPLFPSLLPLSFNSLKPHLDPKNLIQCEPPKIRA